MTPEAPNSDARADWRVAGAVGLCFLVLYLGFAQGRFKGGDEVGVYALHQANAFMLDYLRKKMRLDREAVPVAMAKTGNTGPASIPLMLAIEQRRLRDEGRLHRTLLCGFGVGLSVAAATCDLSETRILDPVYL